MSRKKLVLSRADEVKVLVCEMSAEEIESVISYSQYWLKCIRKREKQLAKQNHGGAQQGAATVSKGPVEAPTLPKGQS